MRAFMHHCLFDFLRCAPARLQLFVPVRRLALNSTFSTRLFVLRVLAYAPMFLCTRIVLFVLSSLWSCHSSFFSCHARACCAAPDADAVVQAAKSKK